MLPSPTVRDALDRFHRYLDESSGPGGLARWQRTQQLIEDLRAMGRAGEDALMRILSSGASSDERQAAARLLGELQVPRALPLLQDVIERESDLLLRRAAASGLRRLQTPESIPVLEAILANPGEDRFVRMSAASGLAQMDRSQGVAGLMQIFEEATADGRGRALAFRALTSLNDERALPFMRQLVSSDAEVSYRLRAIRFLSAQGDRQALPSLQQLMRSAAEQPSIREAAARAHATIASQ
jgi:HEAT repeat protein